MTGLALTNDVRPQGSKPPLGWPLLTCPDQATGTWVWPSLEQSLKNQIQVILRTRPGEQLMTPEFGAGLENQLHEQDSIVTRARIRDLVETGLKQWENRIILDAVSVAPSTEDGREVLISIVYRALFEATPQNLAIAVPVGSV